MYLITYLTTIMYFNSNYKVRPNPKPTFKLCLQTTSTTGNLNKEQDKTIARETGVGSHPSPLPFRRQVQCN